MQTAIATMIRDSSGRLPKEWRAYFPAEIGGVLEIPDRGVPIHPESLRTLAVEAKQAIAIAFRPEVPVSTSLGLPQYEPVAIWWPEEGARRKLNGPDSWTGHKIKRLRRLLGGNSGTQDPWAGIRIVTQTSLEEQIHYFVTHLAAICPWPRQVSVVVGNGCNLTCIMCPYHSPEIKPTHQTEFFVKKQWMTWELLDRIASECGAQKLPVKMGNIEEPLLHPRLLDFVTACRARGVPSVHITTNGLPLTPEKGRAFLDAGLTSIYFSMDAARPETYQRVRGAALHELESNLRAFLDARRATGANCQVMVSFVRNHGVTEEEEREFRARWLDQVDGIIFYNLAEYEEGNSRFAHINQVAKSKLEEAGGRWACLNPWQEMYLLADGRVFYCCETVSKLAFVKMAGVGSYPSQALGEIWLGERFRKLRADLLRNNLSEWPDCRDCGIWMAHVSSTTVEEGRSVTRNMITEIIK